MSLEASHPQASNAATNLSVAAPFVTPLLKVSNHSCPAAFTSAFLPSATNASTLDCNLALIALCPNNIP